VLLGRQATAVATDADGRPTEISHRDPDSKGEVERVAARVVLANCSPMTLSAMLSEPDARRRLEGDYATRELSISLYCAHFGLREPPRRFGLEGFSTVVLPDRVRTLEGIRDTGGLLGADPSSAMPVLGIANYGAIEAGLPDGPSLVSVVGPDRLENWSGLTPEAEKDRRKRWLDAILSALELRYPGFAGAVTETMFVNARSMQAFLGTPGGAVYGFAPLPPERSIFRGYPRSPRTRLPGLYLASAFGGSGGYTGTMMTGAMAARMALAETLQAR
jgi:phytoene dehydrogenase-like protein